MDAKRKKRKTKASAKAPLESKFKKAVKTDLKGLGAYFFVKEEAAIRGIPDIIGWYNGLGFAFELKRSAKEAAKTTGRIALQRHVIGKINDQKCFARITCPETWDDDMDAMVRASYSKQAVTLSKAGSRRDHPDCLPK